MTRIFTFISLLIFDYPGLDLLSLVEVLAETFTKRTIEDGNSTGVKILVSIEEEERSRRECNHSQQTQQPGQTLEG